MTDPDQDFAFVIDLDLELVTFHGFHSAKIVKSFDRDGDETIDREDVVAVVVQMPGEGMLLYYDLSDLPEAVTDTVNH